MMDYIAGNQKLSEKRRLLPFVFILIVLEFLLFFKALPLMMFGLMSFSLSGLIGMMAYITHVFTGRATTKPVVLHEIACTKCGHMNPTDSELCTRCGYYLDRARN